MKLSIIGTGKLGATVAYEALRLPLNQLILIDAIENLAKGEAQDLAQASIGLGKETGIVGSGDISQAKDSDLLILVAGKGRQPGQTRADLLNENKKTIAAIASKLSLSEKTIVIVVTNPVDAMTYHFQKKTNHPRFKVLGFGSLLDTYRLRLWLKGKGIASPKSFAFGEHGENMQFALRDEIPVEPSVIQAAAQAIKLKGYTSWAPAVGIVETAKAILLNEKKILPTSCVLDGEFGLRNVALGVPMLLGRNGCEKILENELSAEEKEKLRKSAEAVRSLSQL